MLKDIQREIQKASNPQKAKILQRFFKTGVGGYGEGDLFLGLTVPQSHSISKKYYEQISMQELEKLLSSKIHEERLIALQMLRLKFQKGDNQEQKAMYDFYLSHTKNINNWDLIDGTADAIVGAYLFEHKKKISILKKLAQSQSVWERRIAIIATYAFIKNREYKDTFKISELLLHDKHDLIQKAVGWMLREVGKRCSREVLVQFLNKHYKTMPRTMLRYSIEHFPEIERKKYLVGTK